MKEIEIYLDVLKRLNYYLLDKRISEHNTFYIMRDESLNDCEILANKDGKISNFNLYNSSISTSGKWMYVNTKYAKIKSKGITRIGDNRSYYTIDSMGKKEFDDYYKEMFRKYKLNDILEC